MVLNGPDDDEEDKNSAKNPWYTRPEEPDPGLIPAWARKDEEKDKDE